jgi:Mu transposase, C-terminal domain
VGYARRNYMVPVPEVNSFQELNDLLRHRCLAEAGRRLRGETETIGEMWEKERPRLLPLPAHPFPCCRTVSVIPNRFSMVTFQTNRYSVPVEGNETSLLLRAFVDRVESTDGVRVAAVHQRCYGREQDVLDVFHYLPLLKKRPAAFDHARPVKMWDRPAVLDDYLVRLRERLPHRTATMEFLHVMELCLTYSLDDVAAAVEQAITMGSLGADTVSYLLRSRQSPREPAVILATAPACPAVQYRDLSQYDRFIRR